MYLEYFELLGIEDYDMRLSLTTGRAGQEVRQ